MLVLMLADLWVGHLIEDLENTESNKLFVMCHAGFNIAKVSTIQIFAFHTQQAHTKYAKICTIRKFSAMQ